LSVRRHRHRPRRPSGADAPDDSHQPRDRSGMGRPRGPDLGSRPEQHWWSGRPFGQPRLIANSSNASSETTRSARANLRGVARRFGWIARGNTSFRIRSPLLRDFREIDSRLSGVVAAAAHGSDTCLLWSELLPCSQCSFRFPRRSRRIRLCGGVRAEWRRIPPERRPRAILEAPRHSHSSRSWWHW
jgi:hypothetical protein